MREDWVEKKLGEFCQFQNGRAFKKSEWSENGLPIIRIANLNNSGAAFNNYSGEYDDKILIQKGDLLFSWSGTVGSSFGPHIWKSDVGLLNQHIYKVGYPKEIDSDFIYYLFLEITSELEKLTNGAVGLVHVKKSTLNDYLVRIPPLTEQKQIVAILDKAFAAIDQAKANIEKNIENAKELFQSKLNSTFDEFIAISNPKKLGSMLETLTDYHANGSYKVLKENVELKDQEDYAWMVRSTDFENDFKNNFKYINEHAYNHLKKSKIFGGEIIISKIGNAGKVYVMPEIDKPCSLAMNLFLLRLNNEEMSSQFLYYYLQSTKGEKQILSKLNGTTTKTITKDSVRDLNIPFVDTDTQNQAVIEFEKINEKTIQLENSYQRKLTELEELKKSILQKAFAGELTVSNHDLKDLKMA